MGRICKFQSNYDDLTKFSLADLKRLDLLVGWATTNIQYTYKGKPKFSFQITVRLGLDYIQPTTGYVELFYRVNGESIRYLVSLVQLPSNLGKGGIWYFICPSTNKRCRTLYLGHKYFVSRHALIGIMYESQTYSKQYRSVAKTFSPIYKLKDAKEELNRPYAKSIYRGELTPKARKVLKCRALLSRSVKTISNQ